MTEVKIPFFREQFIRNDRLQLNLLRPAIEQYVRRWGYYDKETSCKVFEFVVELFKEDMGVGKKKQSKPASKSVSLPNEAESEPAKSEDVVVDGKDDLEL
ncbi:MAG: hypothetical protein J6R22_02975 [Alphaproteobacteria bacterium]|nr:hypothetical protein [Alphaproteobacteria bacterium]